MNDRQRLIELFWETGAFKTGSFTLSSGKQSSYYIDVKKVALSPEGSLLLGRMMLRQIIQFGSKSLNLVGGLTLGADPLVSAVVTVAGVSGWDIRGCIVRKESKGHGTNQYLEGPWKPSDVAVVLEDVTTTGASALLATKRLRAAGVHVMSVLSVVDRMENGSRLSYLNEEPCEGVNFNSLLTIRDFGIEPPQIEATEVV